MKEIGNKRKPLEELNFILNMFYLFFPRGLQIYSLPEELVSFFLSSVDYKI